MAGRSVSELKNGESLDEASPPIIEEKPLPEQPAQEAKPEADPKTEKKDEQIEEEERRCSVMPEQGNGGQGVILKESPYSGSDGLLIEESEAVKSEAKHAARCDELEQEAPAPHQHHKIKKD